MYLILVPYRILFTHTIIYFMAFGYSHIQQLLNFTSFWIQEMKSNSNKAQLLQHIPKITIAEFDHI